MKQYKPIKSNYMNQKEEALMNANMIQSAKKFSVQSVLDLVGKGLKVEDTDEFIKECVKVEKYIWSDVEDGRPKRIVTS